jgi:hypothetical protein
MSRSTEVRGIVVLMIVSIVGFFATIAHGAEVDSAGKVRDVAVCSDGAIYSNTTGRHQGACRGHKGVSKWMDGSAVHHKVPGGHYRKAGTSVSMLDLSVVDPSEGSILPTIVDKGKL